MFDVDDAEEDKVDRPPINQPKKASPRVSAPAKKTGGDSDEEDPDDFKARLAKMLARPPPAATLKVPQRPAANST